MLNQVALDQLFGDLQRVQRRALAQVVADHPVGDAVLARKVLADAAGEDSVLARRRPGLRVDAVLGVVLHDHAGGLAEDVFDLGRSNRVRELRVHRGAVRHHYRHTHTGRSDGDVRGVHDFARLVDHLPLFRCVVLVLPGADLWYQVEGNLRRVDLRVNLTAG